MTAATIVPDTTILIQYQSLDRIDWETVFGVKQVKLLLSTAVLQEMDDIQNQDIAPELSRRAQQALQQLRAMIKRSGEASSSLRVHRMADPRIDFEAEGLDPSYVSDVLVAGIIAHQQTHALEYVILLSDDRETRSTAEAAGIEVRSLPARYLLSSAHTKQVVSAEPSAPFEYEHSVPTTGLFATGEEKLVKMTPLFDPARPGDNGIAHRQEKAFDRTNSGSKASSGDEAPESLEERLEMDATPGESTIDGAPADDLETAVNGEREVAGQNLVTEETESSSILDIKQAPAKPDFGYYEIFNTGTDIDSPQTAAKSNETSDEPDRRKDLSSKNDAPVTITPSFSFTSEVDDDSPDDEEFIPAEPTHTQEEERTELRLAFGDQESRTSVIIHHPVYPSIDAVTEKLAKVRQTHPKLNLPGNGHGGDGLDTSLVDPLGVSPDDVLVQRRMRRLKRYNSVLDTYYANTEKYFGDVAEFDNLRRRSAQLNISLVNDLADSLRSLYIVIHFPSQVRIYTEDTLPERPIGPKPPEKPNLNALFDAIRLPIVTVPGEAFTGNSVKLRSGTITPMEVRWSKGWDVIYSIRDIQKHSRLTFNPLYIVFNSFDHATSFRIQYRVTVASASYEELGELEVVVRKEL